MPTEVQHYRDGQFCGGCMKRWDEHTQPTPKSQAINDTLKMVTGKDREATIRANMCMTCDEDAGDFRDGVSVREYTISGMCQVCQDETFGPAPCGRCGRTYTADELVCSPDAKLCRDCDVV